MKNTQSVQLLYSAQPKPVSTTSTPSPSGSPESAALSDDRPKGDYKTRYPATAWFQIVIEALYLCAVIVCCSLLFATAFFQILAPNTLGTIHFLGYDLGQRPALWIIVAASGATGGACFALKWLYHAVAHHLWNHDRIVWRIVVPLVSAALSVFSGMMIASGIVPFLEMESFDDPTFCAGFGFFVGMFSDHLFAGLQRLARNMFGTMGYKK